MAILSNFNANEIEVQSYDAIPAGWYNAIITESDWCQTKDGTGRYIKFKFQLIDGQFANRVLFLNLNMENRNQQAVDIAKQQLSAICRSINVLQPQDTIELHNLPLAIKVAVRKDTNTGDMQNDIKGFKPKMQLENVAPTASASNAAPWER